MWLKDKTARMLFGMYSLLQQYESLDEEGPSIYAHIFHGAKKGLEEKGLIDRAFAARNLGTMEQILDEIHPRHYERFKAEYDEIRKQYEDVTPIRWCEPRETSREDEKRREAIPDRSEGVQR